jgi:hypothetical protein
MVNNGQQWSTMVNNRQQSSTIVNNRQQSSTIVNNRHGSERSYTRITVAIGDFLQKFKRLTEYDYFLGTLGETPRGGLLRIRVEHLSTELSTDSWI